MVKKKPDSGFQDPFRFCGSHVFLYLVSYLSDLRFSKSIFCSCYHNCDLLYLLNLVGCDFCELSNNSSVKTMPLENVNYFHILLQATLFPLFGKFLWKSICRWNHCLHCRPPSTTLILCCDGAKSWLNLSSKHQLEAENPADPLPCGISQSPRECVTSYFPAFVTEEEYVQIRSVWQSRSNWSVPCKLLKSRSPSKWIHAKCKTQENSELKMSVFKANCAQMTHCNYFKLAKSF